MACLNNLGEIACTMEDCQGAKAYFAEVLEIATETQSVTMLLKVLVNVAVLFAKQGHALGSLIDLQATVRNPLRECALSIE